MAFAPIEQPDGHIGVGVILDRSGNKILQEHHIDVLDELVETEEFVENDDSANIRMLRNVAVFLVTCTAGILIGTLIIMILVLQSSPKKT